MYGTDTVNHSFSVAASATLDIVISPLLWSGAVLAVSIETIVVLNGNGFDKSHQIKFVLGKVKSSLIRQSMKVGFL